MKLKEIKINNFRSIKKCNIILNNICAIVGENNSGKSAILRALNSFFNYSKEQPFFVNGNHQYTRQSHPVIELTFENPPRRITGISKLGNELVLKFTYSPTTKKRAIKYKNKENNFVELLVKDFNSIIKKHINFVFIPPIRDSNELKVQEDSLLEEVLTLYFRKATSKRDNYSSKVKDITNYVEDHALDSVSNELRKFYSLSHNFDFNIKYEQNIGYTLLLKNIKLSILDSGASYHIEDCGSGLQSLTIIALHRYLASLKGRKVIIGIEEPEANLHPQSQRELIKTIKGDSPSSVESQIIFTSHSSSIIDQLDHKEIVLCRKEKEEARGFKSELKQIPNNFWAKYQIEEFQYYNYHKYKNSDFFFSKKVIVTESKNDSEVVKLLFEKDKIDLDTFGISIINLEGVQNLRYPYYLIKELNLPVFLILDKDYFLSYLNNDLKSSRDKNGFPKYSYAYKPDCLIDDFIKKKKTDKDKLLVLFKTNHSKAMDLLCKYNLISFKYTLEIDLIASKKGAELYYDKLKVPIRKRNTSELLVNRKKQIKDVKNLLHVVKDLPHKNMPNSYKRIKKELNNFIKD